MPTFLPKNLKHWRTKKRGFTVVHLQIFKGKSIFLGVGAFSLNLVGAICLTEKKNITFLENDIGFKNQIGWNCSKDKNQNKRRAIQGSMEKSL